MGEGVVGGSVCVCGGGGGKGNKLASILNPFSMMCFIDHDVGYKFLFQVINISHARIMEFFSMVSCARD